MSVKEGIHDSAGWGGFSSWTSSQNFMVLCFYTPSGYILFILYTIVFCFFLQVCPSFQAFLPSFQDRLLHIKLPSVVPLLKLWVLVLEIQNPQYA